MTLEEYIRLQRTDLKKYSNDDILQIYWNQCKSEALDISPVLYKQDTAIDIGCGIGGVTVALANLKPEMHFYMYDQDGQEVQAGMHKCDQFGNSKQYTLEFIERFAENDNVEFVDKLNKKQGVDTVMSFLSMGFHYPVEQYRSYINAVLSEAGLLLIDERKRHELKMRNFRKVGEIPTHNKAIRKVYQRSK